MKEKRKKPYNFDFLGITPRAFVIAVIAVILVTGLTIVAEVLLG